MTPSKSFTRHACQRSCSLVCPADVSQANDPDMCDAGVSFADPAISGSCGVVSCAPPSGSLFPVGTTPDACTGISTIDASTTAMCGFNVTVQDAQTPAIACPPNVVVGTDPGLCSATLNPGTATAADNCPGASVAGVRSDSQPLVGAYPVGTTGITWTATDGAGLQASCGQTVMVNDVQGPTITGASVSNPRLWPPNHKMVSETVSYSAADSCASTFACALSVMSNEPINGLGDGDTAPDWQIVDGHHVLLRAERSGTGTGRTYTIAITCTDGSGNSSSQALIVRVPHSQSQP